MTDTENKFIKAPFPPEILEPINRYQAVSPIAITCPSDQPELHQNRSGEQLRPRLYASRAGLCCPECFTQLQTISAEFVEQCTSYSRVDAKADIATQNTTVRAMESVVKPEIFRFAIAMQHQWNMREKEAADAGAPWENEQAWRTAKTDELLTALVGEVAEYKKTLLTQKQIGKSIGVMDKACDVAMMLLMLTDQTEFNDQHKNWYSNDTYLAEIAAYKKAPPPKPKLQPMGIATSGPNRGRVISSIVPPSQQTVSPWEKMTAPPGGEGHVAYKATVHHSPLGDATVRIYNRYDEILDTQVFTGQDQREYAILGNLLKDTRFFLENWNSCEQKGLWHCDEAIKAKREQARAALPQQRIFRIPAPGGTPQDITGSLNAQPWEADLIDGVALRLKRTQLVDTLRQIRKKKVEAQY